MKYCILINKTIIHFYLHRYEDLVTRIKVPIMAIPMDAVVKSEVLIQELNHHTPMITLENCT